MLTYEDLTQLDPPVAAPPIQTEADADYFRTRMHAWWLAEGIDPDAVKSWAVDHALDDMPGLMLEMLTTDAPHEALLANKAMGYTIGFMYGWLARGKVSA